MPTQGVERAVWKPHTRHMPAGAWGINPIWPLSLGARPFPVLPRAPGPRGDICCPPAGLLRHSCAAGWLHCRAVPSPGTPPCHICGGWLGLHLPCREREPGRSPTAGNKEPREQTKLSFSPRGGRPAPPVPAIPCRGGTSTMMSTLCGLQRGSGFPQGGRWRAFLHLRWVKCPPRAGAQGLASPALS